MELKMLSFDGEEYKDELTRISLPTNDGIRTILNNHMDVVIPVEGGKVKLIKDRERTTVNVSEGMFNFKDNYAQLIVRSFDFPEESDEKVR